jgi:hypothetical protein
MKRKIYLIRVFSFVIAVVAFTACGSPVNKFAHEQLKHQNSEAEKGKLGTFGKTTLSRANFAYYNIDGRSYTFAEVQDMPQALREEIYRRELLRREIVRRGLEEGVFKGAEAEAYIWPRMEKILEEYYHYKKQDYKGIYAANKLRFSGNKAIEQFYEKNKATFLKDKLSVDDIKQQIGKKIQLLTEKEYEEKKNAAVREMLAKEKMDIMR